MSESENRSEQKYSFGTIGVKVSVDGNIDRPQALIDHMLATANAVIGAEAIQQGIGDSQRDEGKLQQQCVASVRFGEITVNAEINFELKRHVSLRTLNTLVFSGILPKIWQTASIYLGDNQLVTTPQSPLTPRSHRFVMDNIDSALALQESVVPTSLSAMGQLPMEGQSERQRQPMTH